ncbi:MAG: hypothetical protein C5B49_05170 [Bdellovibrio sp.]|nr:MAG: hypothetical protein C5B49_05170 [Bdellovibrio sp.]
MHDWFHMETNQLRQFCTLVETSNMRRASELLGISHSGLSKSMKVLQGELGRVLFQPSGRGIVITDQGMDLYRRSAPFFKELDRLLHGSPDDPGTGVVRIGSFEVFTSYFIGHLAKAHLSGVEIEVRELLPGRLEEALALNRVDLGITYEPIPRKGIEYVRVARVKMAVFARRAVFSGKALAEIPFVVPANPLEGTPSGVRGLDAWPENDHARRVLYRVDLMNTGLALVSQGLCAIFMPEFVAHLHNLETPAAHQLEKVEIPRVSVSISRDVFLVRRESMVENEVARKIARAIREVCR